MFGSSGRTCGDNVEIDIAGLLCRGVDYIGLFQARDQW
jgi:hypothetical protein